MEPRALETSKPPAGVYAMPASRVAALLNLGMIPELPAVFQLFTKIEPEMPPGDLLSRAMWYAIGDEFAPRGLIGVEVRFNPNYVRWTLEIWEVRGENYFVVRSLLRFVAGLAKQNGYVVTGETPIENRRFFGWCCRAFGGSITANVTSVRGAWDFRGA